MPVASKPWSLAGALSPALLLASSLTFLLMVSCGETGPRPATGTSGPDGSGPASSLATPAATTPAPASPGARPALTEGTSPTPATNITATPTVGQGVAPQAEPTGTPGVLHGGDPMREAEALVDAGDLIGLTFTAVERALMLPEVSERLDAYLKLRDYELDNRVPPSLFFQPLPAGAELGSDSKPPLWSEPDEIERPANLEDLAFYSVAQLGYLVRTRQVTSSELTEMYLTRLKRFGPKLEAVITLTEEKALEQARKADVEISNGLYRGTLHGIPYGAKDLFSVAGYETTWGATPYKDQMLDETATVVRKLEEAGAVLVAKLSLGALALGDVWFDGRTRNPWNTQQGSSGSSAGPAAPVSAGLVPFALGSETLGSIVSRRRASASLGSGRPSEP